MARGLVRGEHSVLVEHILRLRELLLAHLAMTLDRRIDLLVRHELLNLGGHVVLGRRMARLHR